MIQNERSLRQDILSLVLERWQNYPDRIFPSLLEGSSFLEWFIDESQFIEDESRSQLNEVIWNIVKTSPQQMNDLAEWLIARPGAIASNCFAPEIYAEVVKRRSIPEPDEHWQHYKQEEGESYVIIGTAQFSQVWFNVDGLEPLVLYAKSLIPILQELASSSRFVIQHTETEALLEVKREKSLGWILRPNINILTGKPIVSESLAWGRPLSNFMGVATVEQSSFYRFNRL
jgi:hypothetical protein